MSAQGEKNQLIKPGESPAVPEKSETEISEEKDDDKANIGGTSDPDLLIFILF